MRHARANDHWRRLCDPARERPLKLRSLEFSEVIGLGDGNIPLHQSLTVICGANGVGKSTILKVCGLTLELQTAETVDRDRHSNARVTITVTNTAGHNEEKIFSFDRNIGSVPGDVDIDIHRVDAGADWHRLKNLIAIEANWYELLEQHGERICSDDELAELSYITGKQYSECRLWEIDDYGDGENTFPYFRVTAEGHEYGFEEMGAGEGSLFLIWWYLKQVRRPGVLLLEEPETHVTCRSQRALMNLIAEPCSQRLCCVVTTHSPDIISHVPQECLRLVLRDQGVARIVNAPDDTQLRLVLGVEIPKIVTALVEDECARVLTKEILRVFRSDISSRVHIQIAGSDGDIISILRHFPNSTQGPKIVAVFDGDQKQNYEVPAYPSEFIPDGMKHPVEFLPSTGSPEEFLISVGQNAGQQISAALQVSEYQVIAVLASITGLDHHDWLTEFAERLNIDFERAVSILLNIAIQNADHATECEQLADKLAGHVAPAE